MPKNRHYQETHPWINFRLDFADFNYTLWMLLGRVQAKCSTLRKTPINPNIAHELRQIYLVKGALATTAIEGNTLTEEQVQRYLENQLKLPPSREYMGQEILNVVEGYNQITHEVLGNEIQPFTPERIKAYNALLLRDLPLDEGVVPGEIREHNVTVGRYRGVLVEDCADALQDYCDKLLNVQWEVPADYKMAFEIIRAILAHLYLAWIHPFGDGNGRTARLLEFEILLRAGLPDIAAHLLSNHYNLTKSEYYRHLDKASKSGGDISDFISYALQGFVDGLREQLEIIQFEQLKTQWQQYIYQAFTNKSDKLALRQRGLLLELSKIYFGKASLTEPNPIPLEQLQLLSPEIVRLYAALSERTMKRDLQDLEKQDLVLVDKTGILPRLDRLTAFLPNA